MNGASSTTEAPSGVQGICPKGWHVPSYAEWDVLINYLSSTYDDYADRLSGGCEWVKKSDGNHHPGSYTDARNITGFSAVPAGYFGSDNMFYANIVPQNESQQAVFWTATQQDNSRAYNRKLFDSNSSFSIDNYDPKQNGYSVRCLRDEDSGGGETSQTDPTVTTGAASSIGETSATLNATISNPDNVNITAKGFKYTSDGNNWTTVLGTSEDNSFTTNLTGLTSNTTYTYKAFITFGENTVYGSDSVFSTQSGSTPEPTTFICGTSTVSDADSNPYNTVQIGSQCWMKENLRTTRYNDGSDVTYYDYSESNIPLERRGYLYDWNVTMNQSGSHDICPNGWHVPSIEEWEALNINANQCDNIARDIAANTDWYIYSNCTDECKVCHNLSNHNSSGFSAIPAGYYKEESFDEATESANIWTSTFDNSSDEPEYIIIDIWYGYRPSSNSVENGYSVRCVKDGEATITTSPAANISTTGAWLRGNIVARGNTIIEKGFYWKTTEGGTYVKATPNGTSLIYRLSGLTANTSYTYYAFATTTAGDIYGDEVTFTTSAEPSVSNCGTVTDIDGNTYHTVLIGSQCWMKENLRTVGSLSSFENITNPSVSPFYYQPTTNDFAEYNVSSYGLYYNMFAALNNYNGSGIENPTNHIQGICPDGWHIPSKTEWETLATATEDAPCQLVSSSDWNGNDWGENDVSPGNYGYPYRNQTGFSALPSGLFNATSSETINIHEDAFFWSSSFDEENPIYLNLNYYEEGFLYDNITNITESIDVNPAFPVRCVRNSE